MKYVACEVWTRLRIIEANSIEEAFNKSDPPSNVTGIAKDLKLSNWHVVPVEAEKVATISGRRT